MENPKKLFTREFSWLNRFESQKVTINNPDFHYFSTPQPGYKKVKLFLQDAINICTLEMYYERNDSQNELALDELQQNQEKLLDLSYLNGTLNERRKGIPITQIRSKSLWVEQYTPSKFYELLTEEHLNRNLLIWVKSWDKIVFKKQKQIFKSENKVEKKFGFPNKIQPQQEAAEQFNQNKLILLAGPPGCGKTTLARVVAKHAGYRYIQINASDDRTAKALITRLQNMTKNESISQDKRPTFIIVDEVDGALQSDSNGMKDVLQYIETGETTNKKADNKFKKQKKELHIQRPVLFICNDPYVKGLKQLRKKATIMYFSKIRTEKLFNLLKSICDRQKIYIETEILYKICQLNDNDIRSSISMLEFIAKAKISSGLSPSEILTRIKWQSRDNSQNVMSFVEDVIYQKEKSKFIGIAKLQSKLSEFQSNIALVLQTFFLNYKNCKSIYRNLNELPKLLQTIAQSDVLISQSFDYAYQLNRFTMLPYMHFKINFKNDEYVKLEYPMSFFQRLVKQKANHQILQKLRDGIQDDLKPYINLNSLKYQYIYALFYCIQSNTNQEEELVRCLRTMIRYGIQFNASLISNSNSNNQNNNTHQNNKNYQNNYVQTINYFSPEFDKLLIYNKKPLQLILSNITKNLMISHYKDVKSNAMTSGTQEQELKKTFQLAKKKKRQVQGIKYKFLEGTGTQIKYELKTNYFFT